MKGSSRSAPRNSAIWIRAPSYDELKQAVETAYQHKSYAYRGQRLEELDRFIRRMREGDLVLTPMQASVYLGEVTGPRVLRGFGTRRTRNLRRKVRWFNATEPIDGSSCAPRCLRCCRVRRTWSISPRPTISWRSWSRAG